MRQRLLLDPRDLDLGDAHDAGGLVLGEGVVVTQGDDPGLPGGQAVQGLTQPMIASLTPRDAAALGELMEKSFRRSERMPVQIKLIKELKTIGKS